VLAASLLAGIGSLAGAASAGAQNLDMSAMPPTVLQQLRPGATIENVVAQALQPIRQVDTDGNGLDAADIDLREAIDLANMRAGQVSQVLRADLDADGRVTLSEIQQLNLVETARRNIELDDPSNDRVTSELEGRYLQYDVNGDKTIDLQEMMTQPKRSQRRDRQYEQYRALLSADADRDGKVSVAELESVVRQAFLAIDTDGDGEISRREFGVQQQGIAAAIEDLNVPACALPQPTAAEKLYVLGMYDGAAQPTLAVNGQDDVTHLSRLKIEPGDGPIYLIVGAYAPAIWKLEGAVDRVSRLIVIPGRQSNEGNATWAGAAVMGLAKDKITFAEPGICGGYFYKAAGKEGQRMARAVAKATGRTPDKLIGVYSAVLVSVPSGDVEKKTKDRDMIISGGKTIISTDGEGVQVIEGGLELKAQEDWLASPGGVVDIKPEEVVAPGKVEPYIAIPGQDGLRLLVEQGVLERTAAGYRLLKPLTRWPAGLSGAHSVTFILPKGMAEPAGSAGHSRVIYEK
jgi:hypothetical protein